MNKTKTEKEKEMHREMMHEAFKVMQELAGYGVEVEFNARGPNVWVTWDDGVKQEFDTIWKAAKVLEGTVEW